LPRERKVGAMEAQERRKWRTLAWEATGLVSSSGLPPYSTSPVIQMRLGQ